MTRPRSIRIDRLVVDGARLTQGEARSLAERVAEQLAANWGDGPGVVQDNVRLHIAAPNGLAAAPLAQLVASELRRKLG